MPAGAQALVGLQGLVSLGAAGALTCSRDRPHATQDI